MARNLVVLQHVGVLAQGVGGHVARAGQPGEGAVDLRGVAGAIDLGAVAGGENGGFGLTRVELAQRVQRGRQAVHGKSKPPAQIQRGSVVVQSQRGQLVAGCAMPCWQGQAMMLM